MEMYDDTLEEAKHNLQRSDKARASYYHSISGLNFGDARNYELCIDSSIGGVEETENPIDVPIIKTHHLYYEQLID